MKAFALFLVTWFLIVAGPGWCEEPDESLGALMSGEYELIGRRPDATTTYTGHVTISKEGDVIKVTRKIDGKTEVGTAKFDTAAGADKIPVLRMQFKFEGVDYEGTFIWKSDLDNFFRFTGYIYLPKSGITKSPGLEALFPSLER